MGVGVDPATDSADPKPKTPNPKTLTLKPRNAGLVCRSLGSSGSFPPRAPELPRLALQSLPVPCCAWVVVKIMVPLFLGILNTRCRIIIGIEKGTLILTTTHMKPNSGGDLARIQAVRRVAKASSHAGGVSPHVHMGLGFRVLGFRV